MTKNLGGIGALCLLGGGLVWVLVLLLLDNTDFNTSAVVIAALGTLAVILPAVMLLGVVAFIIGAAIRDTTNDRLELETALMELGPLDEVDA